MSMGFWLYVCSYQGTGLSASKNAPIASTMKGKMYTAPTPETKGTSRDTALKRVVRSSL